ncbi:unnamed protein product, partial [Urochloa humidicola]
LDSRFFLAPGEFPTSPLPPSVASPPPPPPPPSVAGAHLPQRSRRAARAPCLLDGACGVASHAGPSGGRQSGNRMCGIGGGVWGAAMAQGEVAASGPAAARGVRRQAWRAGPRRAELRWPELRLFEAAEVSGAG